MRALTGETLDGDGDDEGEESEFERDGGIWDESPGVALLDGDGTCWSDTSLVPGVVVSPFAGEMTSEEAGFLLRVFNDGEEESSASSLFSFVVLGVSVSPFAGETISEEAGFLLRVFDDGEERSSASSLLCEMTSEVASFLQRVFDDGEEIESSASSLLRFTLDRGWLFVAASGSFFTDVITPPGIVFVFGEAPSLTFLLHGPLPRVSIKTPILFFIFPFINFATQTPPL